MLPNIQSSSALVQTFTMLGMDHSEGLCMYSVEIIKLLVIDSPVLFLLRYIVNRFGLEIAIDLVRAVDLESVEILGRIMQFPCWMLIMKQHA